MFFQVTKSETEEENLSEAESGIDSDHEVEVVVVQSSLKQHEKDALIRTVEHKDVEENRVINEMYGEMSKNCCLNACNKKITKEIAVDHR